MNAAKTTLAIFCFAASMTMTSCGGSGGGNDDANAPEATAPRGQHLGLGGRLDGEWIVVDRTETGEAVAEEGLQFEVSYGLVGSRLVFEDGLLVSYEGQEANSFVPGYMFVNATISTPHTSTTCGFDGPRTSAIAARPKRSPRVR